MAAPVAEDSARRQAPKWKKPALLMAKVVIAGIVLWAVSPGDKAWFEQHNLGASFIGNLNEVQFALTGSW